MPPKPFHRRPLRFESLERREVMAGNIGAAVINGELRITGTAQDNSVVLYQGAQSGQVVVAGAKDAAGGNTLVKGSAEPLTFSGVTRVTLYMKEGNDRVLVTNLNLPTPAAGQRSITDDMGNGNDGLVISGDTGTARNFTLNQGTAVPYGPVNIAGSVFALGGAGNDAMNIVNASLGGTDSLPSGFDGGDGNDSFLVDGSLAKNNIGSLRLLPGGGADAISIKRANIAGILEIEKRAPPAAVPPVSNIELYNVRVGSGIAILLNTAVQANISIDSPVDPAQRLRAASIVIDSEGTDGAGDHIAVRHAQFGFGNIVTANDPDSVEVTDTVWTDGLTVRLYDGADSLTVKNVTIMRAGEFDGGAGPAIDTYIDQGGNTLTGVTIKNFEQ